MRQRQIWLRNIWSLFKIIGNGRFKLAGMQPTSCICLSSCYRAEVYYRLYRPGVTKTSFHGTTLAGRWFTYTSALLFHLSYDGLG